MDIEPPGRASRLLRFLERCTQTDLGYLASGGTWLVIDQVAGGLAAFLLAIAFAHFVPKDVYGNYRYLLASFWVLTAFTFTGIPVAMAQAVARGKEGAFRASLGASALWGLPMSVLALGASVYYFVQANSVFGFGFLIIAVLGPLVQPASLYGAYLAAKKDFQMYALMGAVFVAVQAIALFATMFVSRTPLAFLIAYFAGTIGIGIAITAYVFYQYRPNAVEDSEFKALGAHFSAMNLLSTLVAQIDKLVVFHYLGAVDLAVYAFATALPDQVRAALGGISVLALPKFVARPFNEIRQNFWLRLWLYTGAMALVALLYALAAPYFFDIFFPAYREAIFYSQIYAVALIPIGSALPVTLLQAHEAKRELYILNVVTPVFTILILIWLTASYGLLGTVIARIIGRAWGFLVAGVMVEIYSLEKA